MIKAVTYLVDAQVHLWAAESPDRPWPAGRAAEAQKPYPISAETLLFQMDLAGVSRAVLVPPSWEGDRNDVALATAATYPDRFAVMGRLDLADAEAGRVALAGWRNQPGLLGVRVTLHNRHYRHLIEAGVAEWFWARAEELGIPVMVLVPGLLEELDAIASRHPDLKLVIDHLGVSLRDGVAGFDALGDVCGLARHPNIAIKASGMPSWSTQPFPFPDVHDGIRRVFDAFGPQRTFWGTDLTRMPCTYYECIHLFTDHLPWLSGEDLEWVMGRGVCEWLGWSR